MRGFFPEKKKRGLKKWSPQKEAFHTNPKIRGNPPKSPCRNLKKRGSKKRPLKKGPPKESPLWKNPPN